MADFALSKASISIYAVVVSSHLFIHIKFGGLLKQNRPTKPIENFSYA